MGTRQTLRAVRFTFTKVSLTQKAAARSEGEVETRGHGG